MLPLLAVMAAPTLLETCAAVTAVVAALKLGLETLEIGQRVRAKRQETAK